MSLLLLFNQPVPIKPVWDTGLSRFARPWVAVNSFEDIQPSPLVVLIPAVTGPVLRAPVISRLLTANPWVAVNGGTLPSLLETLLGITPFAPPDLPLVGFVRRWVDYPYSPETPYPLSPEILGPFVQNDWPLPNVRRVQQNEIPPLLATLFPGAQPFAQTDWPLPNTWRVYQVDITPDLVLLFPSGEPFAQLDWPPPYIVPASQGDSPPDLALTTLFGPPQRPFIPPDIQIWRPQFVVRPIVIMRPGAPSQAAPPAITIGEFSGFIANLGMMMGRRGR